MADTKWNSLDPIVVVVCSYITSNRLPNAPATAPFLCDLPTEITFTIGIWLPCAKSPPGCDLKILKKQGFANLLTENLTRGSEAVYSLTNISTNRMSFVEGWGAGYRQHLITSTSRWIEIHLNGPLQWVDRNLSRMDSPYQPCTSVV